MNVQACILETAQLIMSLSLYTVQGEKADDSFHDRSGSTSSNKPLIVGVRHSCKGTIIVI